MERARAVERRPSQAEPDGPPFEARLPSGVTVELVGVGENKTDGVWWGPDGTPKTRIATYDLPGVSGAAPEPGFAAREFIVRLGNLPSEPVTSQFEFNPVIAGSGSSTGAVFDAPIRFALATKVPLTMQSVTVRFGLAAKPWLTRAESHKDLIVSLVGNNEQATFSDAYEEDGGVAVTCVYTIANQDARIIAVGNDGRERSPTTCVGVGDRGFRRLTAKFSQLSLKEVKTFRLQTRPYEWVEFHNVSLRLGQKTNMQVVVPGGPLPDGKPAPTDDRKQILGTWNAVFNSSWRKMFKNAGKSPEGGEIGVPIDAGDVAALQMVQFVITKDSLLNSKYRLDPTKTPKTVDLLHDDGKTLIAVGIYELDGDRLRLRFSTTPQRPTKLSYDPLQDGDDVYLVLQRGNAASENGSADGKPEEPAKPQGPVLTYEVAPGSAPAEMSPSERDKLQQAVDRRLNSGAEKLARVRKLEAGQIEVAMLRQNEAERQRVERLLAHPGTLEFRILANSRQDKAVIEQAQRDRTKTDVLDPSGKRLAWWVPVKAGEERSFAGYTDIARRTKKQDDQEVTEILVVADPYNVTSASLTKAEASADSRGNPCINFTFNDSGGKLFGKLTGDHLPDTSTDFTYMGIILDGELCSAPLIRSRISDKGVIAGLFTKEQVSDLADVLNTGSLPVRLRLVERPAPAVAAPGM